MEFKRVQNQNATGECGSIEATFQADSLEQAIDITKKAYCWYWHGWDLYERVGRDLLFRGYVGKDGLTS